MTSPAHAPDPHGPEPARPALSIVATYREACLRASGDRAAEARGWLEAALGTKPVPPLLLIIGLGQGHLLDVLETRAPHVRVLALEPDPEVARVFSRRRDWSEWLVSGRLAYLAGPDYAGADEAWRLFPDDPNARALLVHPILARDGGDAAVQAAKTVKKILFGVSANADARRSFAPRYLANTLANLSAIVGEADVAPFFDAFRGVPAIITAAGPSLDRNIDGLRSVGDRALLIAVDTTVRPLAAAGIEPHLIVSVDPSEANARHLVGAPAGSQAILVAEPSVDPRVLRQFPQRTALFRLGTHEPWPWLRRHALTVGQLRAWGSVLTTAFDLAVRAGCNPIAFAGADLAFTNEQPYCRGTVYEEGWAKAIELGYEQWFTWRSEIDARGAVPTTDLHGQPTRSSPSLQSFRDWLVEQTTRIDRRFINVSDAGILAGGRIEQGRIADVLMSGREPHVRARLRKLPRRSPSATRSLLTRVLDELEAASTSGLVEAWSRFTLQPADAMAAQVAAIAASLREH